MLPQGLIEMKNDSVLRAEQLSPLDLKEALLLRKRNFVPIAGGSDLLIRMHSIQKSESHGLVKGVCFDPVFYTGRISGLDSIEKSCGTISFGASSTLSEIIKSELCPSILREALVSIASPGIRNAATLSGNICNASPAGDSLPVLYILDAVIETAAVDEKENIIRRNIPIADFIIGPGKTFSEMMNF